MWDVVTDPALTYTVVKLSRIAKEGGHSIGQGLLVCISIQALSEFFMFNLLQTLHDCFFGEYSEMIWLCPRGQIFGLLVFYRWVRFYISAH